MAGPGGMGGGSNWMYLQQPPGQGTPTFGGGAHPIRFRNQLDATRSMMTGRTPQAEYPDGYLGTTHSRREDRLLQAVQSRLTQRSYQRGVHKGERVDPNDYFWTREVNPGIALEYEARGLKWTQSGATVQEKLVNGGKPGPQDLKRLANLVGIDEAQYSGPVIVTDPHRRSQLLSLRPDWR